MTNKAKDTANYWFGVTAGVALTLALHPKWWLIPLCVALGIFFTWRDNREVVR